MEKLAPGEDGGQFKKQKKMQNKLLCSLSAYSHLGHKNIFYIIEKLAEKVRNGHQYHHEHTNTD